MLLSLFTDRLLQISGRGGEFNNGLPRIFGVFGVPNCLWLSLGGKGGVSETALSESFVMLLLSDILLDNPGESE